MVRKYTDKSSIDNIIFLRKHGYSLPEISQKTNIPKTTVYRFIKDVKILPEYLVTWAAKRGGSKRRKKLKVEQANFDGKQLVGRLTDKEKLLLFSALYWGEGSKKDFSLSNTDPELIRVFIGILREVFKISNDKLRVSIRIYEDLNRNKCISYWSKILDIPEKEFGNVNVLNGRKKGKLKFGMCRIRLSKGGDLLKRINGINLAVKSYFAPIA